MAKALVALLQHRGRAAAMGQLARRRILSVRTWDVAAENLLEVISKMPTETV